MAAVANLQRTMPSHGLSASIRSLSVRVGLDAGPVIMFEGDDYIGRPVNTASRLCDAAEPAQVLATDRIVARVPPWITVGAVSRLDLRTINLPVDAVTLAMIDPGARAATDPVCGLTIPPEVAVPGGSLLPPGTGFCSPACAESWPRHEATERLRSLRPGARASHRRHEPTHG